MQRLRRPGARWWLRVSAHELRFQRRATFGFRGHNACYAYIALALAPEMSRWSIALGRDLRDNGHEVLAARRRRARGGCVVVLLADLYASAPRWRSLNFDDGLPILGRSRLQVITHRD